MNNDGKKISFSFSKVKKPGLGNKTNSEPKEKIEYVDCFDGAKGTFSFKGTPKSEPDTKKELVIPLVNQNTSADIIRNKIKEKSYKSKPENVQKNDNGVEVNKPENTNSKNLEELAAKEILRDLKNHSSQESNSNFVIAPADTSDNSKPETESEANIDYENVPVSEFGLAMLRGMGWKPGCGIGKEPRIVETVSPKLRPKGLGLGAKPLPEVPDEKKKST